MTAFRCDACGATLTCSVLKVKVGAREYCGPEASPCHALGVRNARWTLAPHEAAELLADAAALAS